MDFGVRVHILFCSCSFPLPSSGSQFPRLIGSAASFPGRSLAPRPLCNPAIRPELFTARRAGLSFPARVDWPGPSAAIPRSGPLVDRPTDRPTDWRVCWEPHLHNRRPMRRRVGDCPHSRRRRFVGRPETTEDNRRPLRRVPGPPGVTSERRGGCAVVGGKGDTEFGNDDGAE